MQLASLDAWDGVADRGQEACLLGLWWEFSKTEHAGCRHS